MPTNERSLYVIAAECFDFRYSGLAEFEGLVKAVAERSDEATTHWTRAKLIVPAYAQISCAPHRQTMPIDASAVTAKCNRITRFENSALIWHQFGRHVHDFIAADAKGTVDVIGVDWPSAGALQQLKADININARVCLAVDLVPQANTESYRLWQVGLQIADVVQCASSGWWSHLACSHQAARAAASKVAIVPYGVSNADATQISPENKREAKTTVLKKHEGSQSLSTMVAIARHRLTEDDQKNYESMVYVLKQLFKETATDADRPSVFVLGPYSPCTGERARNIRDQLESLRSRFPSCLMVEPPDLPHRIPWKTLLAAADLQLVPSRYEPWGVNTIEGMQFGVVPCASNSGCMQEEVFVPRKNCYRFDWDDDQPIESQTRLLEALRTAVDTYFDAPNQWHEIRKQTMVAAETFRWDALLDRYAAMFSDTAQPR